MNMQRSIFGKKVVTPEGRIKFPHLFRPNAKYGSDKCSVELLIPKSSDITELKEAMKAVVQEAFGAAVKGPKDLAFPPIIDGDTPNMDGKVYDENKGHWIIRGKGKKNQMPIKIVDHGLRVVTDEKEVYPGRNARLALVPYSYRQGSRPGISWQLRSVQLLPGGDRFALSPEDGDDGNDFMPVEVSVESQIAFKLDDEVQDDSF